MIRNCLLPAFFVFLRTGELTVPTGSSYNPSVHLSVGDIAVDHPSRPLFVCVTIKQSKTDPFRKGVDLFIGRTGLHHKDTGEVGEFSLPAVRIFEYQGSNWRVTQVCWWHERTAPDVVSISVHISAFIIPSKMHVGAAFPTYSDPNITFERVFQSRLVTRLLFLQQQKK